MRILYVSHTHPPAGTILDNVGGMQRVSRQLIDEVQRMDDVEVMLHTTNVSGNGQIALQATGFLLSSLVEIPVKVREHGVDVILFSSMVSASLAFFLQHRVDVPMVTINHGRDVKLRFPPYQWFVPHVFEALDGVISVSSATRAECIKRGMEPAKGVALPNGFNLDTMNSMPEKEAARQALGRAFGIPLGTNRMLLTVGRQVERKGHEWFINEVLPRIHSDVTYVVVGDGPMAETIEQAASQSPMHDRIFLLGRQPDAVLKQAYAAADLFVMPNIPVKGDMEGFGIVLLEANMAQTPAVASDLEGIKDVITPGKNGYRVPVLDADAFARHVDKVLGDNLATFSKATKTFVRAEFAWQVVARKYIDYLADVVAPKGTE